MGEGATTLPLRAALIGAAFILSAGYAAADPVAPAVMVPALDLYVDTIVAAHNGALACAKPASPARDEQAWQVGRAVFIATLWANGFPADFVRAADKRLSAPSAPASCDDPSAFTFGGADNEGWQKTFDHPLEAMDLTPVAQPASGEAWSSIKSAIADELPKQSRLFECIAAVYPDVMPAMVHDWDEMIVKIGGKLVAAGLPRDEITTALSAAEANSLWHRAEADKVRDLATACQADQAWQQEFGAFAFLGLADHIDKLLPQPPADSDSGQ